MLFLKVLFAFILCVVALCFAAALWHFLWAVPKYLEDINTELKKINNRGGRR